MIDYDFVLKDNNADEKESSISDIAGIGDIAEIKDVFSVEVAKSKLKAFSVEDMRQRAVALVVDTDSEAKAGVAMAMQCRKLYNSLEKTRKEIVRPHLDFQKAVKKYSDGFADFFKKTERQLLKKVEAYQLAAEIERKKSIAEQVRKETEFRLKREKEQRDFDEAIRLRDIEIERSRIKAKKEDMPMPIPPPLPEAPMPIVQDLILPIAAATKKIESEEGSSTTVIEWHYEILDTALIPRDFLIIDEQKIKAAVKSGVRVIPGVCVFETKVRKYRVKG